MFYICLMFFDQGFFLLSFNFQGQEESLGNLLGSSMWCHSC